MYKIRSEESRGQSLAVACYKHQFKNAENRYVTASWDERYDGEGPAASGERNREPDLA